MKARATQNIEKVLFIVDVSALLRKKTTFSRYSNFYNNFSSEKFATMADPVKEEVFNELYAYALSDCLKVIVYRKRVKDLRLNKQNTY